MPPAYMQDLLHIYAAGLHVCSRAARMQQSCIYSRAARRQQGCIYAAGLHISSRAHICTGGAYMH